MAILKEKQSKKHNHDGCPPKLEIAGMLAIEITAQFVSYGYLRDYNNNWT